MEKLQARSRLKKPLATVPAPISAPSRLVKSPQKAKVVKKPNKRLQAYWQHSISLIIAVLIYYGLFFLMKRIYPAQIQNFLWTNSYLPFFSLLFLANFFLLTFLFLDKKIGFYLAIWLNLALYLKINQIQFDFYSLGLLFLLAAILLLPDIIKHHVSKK